MLTDYSLCMMHTPSRDIHFVIRSGVVSILKAPSFFFLFFSLQGDNGGPDCKSILRQQNHELAVDMRRRKRQEAELEVKLAQAWAKQGHFDATLSAVNRAWSQASGKDAGRCWVLLFRRRLFSSFFTGNISHNQHYAVEPVGCNDPENPKIGLRWVHGFCCTEVGNRLPLCSAVLSVCLESAHDPA